MLLEKWYKKILQPGNTIQSNNLDIKSIYVDNGMVYAAGNYYFNNWTGCYWIKADN